MTLLALCFKSVLHLCFCVFVDTWESSCENMSPYLVLPFLIFVLSSGFFLRAFQTIHFRTCNAGAWLQVWMAGFSGILTASSWALSLLRLGPVQFLDSFHVAVQGRYWPQQLIVILCLKAQQRYHVFCVVQHHLWLLSTLSHACFVFSVLY